MEVERRSGRGISRAMAIFHIEALSLQPVGGWHALFNPSHRTPDSQWIRSSVSKHIFFYFFYLHFQPNRAILDIQINDRNTINSAHPKVGRISIQSPAHSEYICLSPHTQTSTSTNTHTQPSISTYTPAQHSHLPLPHVYTSTDTLHDEGKHIFRVKMCRGPLKDIRGIWEQVCSFSVFSVLMHDPYDSS